MSEQLMTGCRVSVLLLTLLVSHVASGEPQLQTNPFMQPDGFAPLTGRAHGKMAGSVAETMELRGIMRAGAHSLADIGGTIVAIGQVVNGYTLVAVHERHVVLDKEGSRKELPVVADKGAGGNEKRFK